MSAKLRKRQNDRNAERRYLRASLREARLEIGKGWKARLDALAEQPRSKDEIARLRAAMVAAHPDKGGTDAAFRVARELYMAAKRKQK